MTTTDNDNWVSKTILVVPKRSRRVLSLHKSRLMKKQGCNSLKSKVAAMVKAQPELKVGGLGRCSSFSKRPFSGSSRSFSGVTNLVQQYLFVYLISAKAIGTLKWRTSEKTQSLFNSCFILFHRKKTVWKSRSRNDFLQSPTLQQH